MAIWLCFIAKGTLAIWRHPIAKCTLAIWQQPIAKHSLVILATSYCLNRNNRVSSFYWTRGSKLCFLTCLSYFSCYCTFDLNSLSGLWKSIFLLCSHWDYWRAGQKNKRLHLWHDMMIGICWDILGGRLLRDYLGLIHVLRNLDLK